MNNFLNGMTSFNLFPQEQRVDLKKYANPWQQVARSFAQTGDAMRLALNAANQELASYGRSCN
jgi:hypothetical protein